MNLKINNAKTDEGTYEEFKIIGKAVRKVWEERLGKSLKTHCDLI